MFVLVNGKAGSYPDEKLCCEFVAVAALVYILCSEKYMCIINFIYDEINSKLESL